MDQPGYRAGLVDARLDAIERHAAAVNGSIDRVAVALNGLTVAVAANGVKMDSFQDVLPRLARLERLRAEDIGVDRFRQWVTPVAVAVAAVGLSLLQFFH